MPCVWMARKPHTMSTKVTLINLSSAFREEHGAAAFRPTFRPLFKVATIEAKPLWAVRLTTLQP